METELEFSEGDIKRLMAFGFSRKAIQRYPWLCKTMHDMAVGYYLKGRSELALLKDLKARLEIEYMRLKEDEHRKIFQQPVVSMKDAKKFIKRQRY